MAAVDARVTGLLKGCKCKTGCSSKRCSCRNKGKEWSIGCDCINCTNTLTKGNEDLLDIVEDEYLAEVTEESTGVPNDANDIMDWCLVVKIWKMTRNISLKINNQTHIRIVYS